MNYLPQPSSSHLSHDDNHISYQNGKSKLISRNGSNRYHNVVFLRIPGFWEVGCTPLTQLGVPLGSFHRFIYVHKV